MLKARKLVSELQATRTLLNIKMKIERKMHSKTQAQSRLE